MHTPHSYATFVRPTGVLGPLRIRALWERVLSAPALPCVERASPNRRCNFFFRSSTSTLQPFHLTPQTLDNPYVIMSPLYFSHGSASPAFITALPFLSSTTAHTVLSSSRRPEKPFRAPSRRCMTMTADGVTSSPSPETLLIRSAMMKDALGVRSALDAGAPAGYRAAPSGMTSLMWAASEGDIETAKLLLDTGLSVDDINAVTTDGYTAMLYAMEGLPNANPKPPMPPGFPMDPKRRNEKVERKVDTSPKITGHGSVAKLLLMRGADLSVQNRYGESLIALATRKGQTEWMRLLFETAGGGIDGMSLGYKQTPLHLAAMEGHAESVKYLLSVGAEVDAKNVVGWTPLLWASATGATECVEILVEAGADVNLSAPGTPKDDGTQTVTNPLREARKSADAREVSRILILAGALE